MLHTFIGEPREFVRQMNSLVMQMTHTRKKKNGQMLLKKILRQMNHLLKIIESHGQRYFMLLENHWEESDLTENESHIILERLQAQATSSCNEYSHA